MSSLGIRGLARLACAVVLMAASAAPAQKFDKPFHTVVVLPATTTSKSDRMAPWTLGWQYLIQERLREFPGIDVPRLQSQSDFVDQWQAGTLDVTKMAVRDQIAKAFGADLIVAPAIVAGPPEWAVKIDLIDTKVGPEPRELVTAKGALPTSVVDSAAVAILKAVFAEDNITLEPWSAATAVAGAAPVDIPAAAVSQFVATFSLWPYTEKADAGKGKLDQALLSMEALARGGSPLWLMYQRAAMCTIAAGKPQLGLAGLQNWAGRETRGTRSHLLVGQLQVASGNDAAAAPELLQAANNSRGSIPAVTALAGCLKHMGQPAAALAQYDAAATMWPNVLPFQMARGQLALDNEQPELALRAFRAATQLAPGNRAALLGLAKAQVATGRPADAVLTAAELLKGTPDDPAVLEISANAALAAGQWDVAIASATKLVALPESKVEALVVLGRANYGKQDWPAAMAALGRACKKLPKDIDLVRTLSSACVLGGKPEEAVAALTAALAAIEDSKRPGLQVDLASAQFYAGQLDPALATARESLKASPNQPAARFLEARLLVYKLQYAEAIKAEETALGLAGANGAPLQAAVADLEGDVKASPALDGAKLVLGYLYEAAGRAKDARQLYRSYELSPKADAALKTWAQERMKQIDNPRAVGQRPGTPRPI